MGNMFGMKSYVTKQHETEQTELFWGSGVRCSSITKKNQTYTGVPRGNVASLAVMYDIQALFIA
jgi:hypothetical protein